MNFAIAFIFLFGFSSAAELNLFTATPYSYTANASTVYNFTINVSSYTNLTNITLAFPAGFHISLATNPSGSANLTNGTLSISGQNLTYNLNQSYIFKQSENFTFGIVGIYNPSTAASYSIGVVTYNSSGTIDGNATSVTITAGAIAKANLSSLFPVTTSGSTYTIMVTGQDAYGNVNNTGGFNVSSSNSSVSVNVTGTNFTFNAVLAGNTTLVFSSYGNGSVSNTTNASVIAAALMKIEQSSIFPVATSGATYSVTLAGRDLNGNINNSGGFNVSIGNSTVTTLSSNTTVLFTYNALIAGNSSLTYLSLANTSATNATNASVVASVISKIEISPLFPVVGSGTVFSFTVNARDAFGNINNSGGLNVTVGNTTVTYVTSNTSTVFNLYANRLGNSSLTAVSLINSSATNSTNASVVAGVPMRMQIATVNPSTMSGITYALTLSGYDINGNQNDTGGFNVSIANSTVTTLQSNTSTAFTFNALSAGISQLNFMMLANTSATNATNSTVVSAQIVKMDVSLLSLTQASGNTYTITLTGRDAYGNANNSLGFNVSSSNSSVTTNTSGGPAVFTFSSLSAGTSTITYYSLVNSSVTNQTNVTMVAGAISKLELSQLNPSTVAGATYNIIVTGRDNFGNINNSGGFNVSSSNATVSTNTSGGPTSFTFNALVNGGTTLTFQSLLNLSALNTTVSNVTSSGMVKVDISPIYPVRASGTNVTFTVTGRDVYGNVINTGGFLFSVSDGTVLSLITNTSTTAIYTGTIAGNSSFTVTSAANSSITNSTNASVIAGTVSQILLTPQAPSLSLGASQQFTATAKDAAGNTNTTVTINWARVNLVGTGAINSSGFFENTTGAGIVTINASYATIVNLTNATISAGSVVRVEISPLFPANMSGRNFTFTVTGRDYLGNANNNGGFLFSVGDGTVLSLISNTSTVAIYSGVLAGNSSFTVTSATNSSVTNSTNASVIVGVVSQILLTPQAPTLSLGGSQQFTATAKDANFNTNTTVTITWARVNLTGVGAISSSGFFENTTTAGIVTVNASYGAIVNLTNVTLAAGPIVRVEISPLNPTNSSGKNFTFTVTGRDANGNANNTGGFIFSVGNTSTLSLITNTSTTAIYSGVLSGINTTFTVTSALNSSVTNSTNATVIAGTVSRIALTPQSPSLTVGGS
ncbi:MAG: Ig-like domain-containing protein, partial [Candidatus Micrarchaeota archaeon]